MDKVLKGFATDGDGFVFMWAIAVVGLIAFAIAAERFYYIFLKSSKGRKVFMQDIAAFLKSNKLAEAASYASQGETPLAKILTAILNARDKGEKGMTQALDETFLTEAPRLNRYIAILISLANVSTLTGLLGTIYGLILSFDAVANLPAAQRPQALADGIAVAMGTTFLGLVFAIPLMLVAGILTMQSDRLVEEMEEKALKVINLL